VCKSGNDGFNFLLHGNENNVLASKAASKEGGKKHACRPNDFRSSSTHRDYPNTQLSEKMALVEYNCTCASRIIFLFYSETDTEKEKFIAGCVGGRN